MTNNTTPKTLTNDEKKAADAAFAGRPFNASWSASARTVYDGIVNALPKDAVPALPEVDAVLAELEATLPAVSHVEHAPLSDTDSKPEDAAADTTAESNVPTIRDRQEAIQSGILIDVTPTAKELGLTFPVTITKPLWDLGIVTNHSLSQEEQTGRLRDILMAFRLRLASLATVSPLIDFPALLAMPPSTVPQPVPLFAIIQPDSGNQANVTLLLPNEVSLTITPSN
ncbi:DUF6573 family protein [Nitrospira lenta]|uniref:Uncharacterized protein n=1 Tax=Nitrospira lenta TaxID=1436998 RepID=A0A330L0E3_9BACT|nr:DUF6573 family protein [Nitrospira lenta]SPP63261.1 hypothetical protein NITLEN_10347 [Nitrospira lenta]